LLSDGCCDAFGIQPLDIALCERRARQECEAQQESRDSLADFISASLGIWDTAIGGFATLVMPPQQTRLLPRDQEAS
jgi:hypothetical protein